MIETIQASDGTTIPVSWNKNGHEVVLLFCHGITSCRDEDGIFSSFYCTYFANQMDAFYFDFRGHGQSAVIPEHATIRGMRDDFKTCLEHLHKIGYKKIIVIAASFGASIVLLEIPFLHRDLISALVFWNPVVSYQDTFVTPLTEWARNFFPGKEPRDTSFSSFVHIPDTNFIIGPEMAQEIALLHPEEVTLPLGTTLLCIHGTEDRHVPYSVTEEFCVRNSHSAQFYSISGASHGFPDHADELYRVTAEWIQTHIL